MRVRQSATTGWPTNRTPKYDVRGWVQRIHRNLPSPQKRFRHTVAPTYDGTDLCSGDNQPVRRFRPLQVNRRVREGPKQSHRQRPITLDRHERHPSHDTRKPPLPVDQPKGRGRQHRAHQQEQRRVANPQDVKQLPSFVSRPAWCGWGRGVIT